MLASAVTARTCVIILALLFASQITIFAYSATPSTFMFKTILTTSNFNKRHRNTRDASINHSAELELLVAPTVTNDDDHGVPVDALLHQEHHPSLVSTVDASAPRSNLFRRRAIEESQVNGVTLAGGPAAGVVSLASFRQITSPFNMVRGGAITGKNLLVAAFLKFANFIGQSKTRCFLLLMFSVLIESYATTLSKQAKDTGNAFLFVRACFVYIMCMIGFNISLAQLDVSVAYAVWSALGTTLVTAVGFFYFGESLDIQKILYLCMIVCGVIGLNLRG